MDCVAEAVHEVASHRGGWAVSLHGGVSGGIRGGVLQGCCAQGGLGRNEGGGGSAIPRYQPSPFILWRVGTVISVERGHGRVAGQDAHIVPPLGLHCLPLKRKVRMVSLRLTGRKIYIDGNHVHPHGAVNEASGGVDGTKARLGLAHGVRGHDSQKALHRVAGGNEPDGPQPREGHLQLPEKVSGTTLFPKPSRPFGGAHVHMDHLGGHGQPFRPPHHLLHCQAPRVRGLLQRAGAKGEALVVAQGAVGRVGEGEGPDLGHGDRLLGGHGHRKSESEVRTKDMQHADAKSKGYSREVRANVKAHMNANLVANLGCECEREFEFYLRI